MHELDRVVVLLHVDQSFSTTARRWTLCVGDTLESAWNPVVAHQRRPIIRGGFALLSMFALAGDFSGANNIGEVHEAHTCCSFSGSPGRPSLSVAVQLDRDGVPVHGQQLRAAARVAIGGFTTREGQMRVDLVAGPLLSTRDEEPNK